MVALANDPDPAVVCDAIQILGRRQATSAVPMLRTLAEANDENVTVSAIEALGRIGGAAAVETLIAAASSDKFFRVFPAIDVLGRTGDPRAVAPLASLLNTPLYAFEAARALARTAESSAVAPLVRLVTGRSDATSRTAAMALAELHERAEERHGSAAAIVRALAALPDRAVISRRLSHSLRDAEPGEKVAISVVLGSLGSQESVAILTTLVEEPPPVGAAAAGALGRLANSTQAELARVLRDGGSAQRLAVLPLVTRALPLDVLDRCLEDEDPDVRRAACDAFARRADPTRVGPLFTLLSDPAPAVVQAAIAAIQSLGGEDTERRAIELAESKNGSLRRSALRILAYFGHPSAFDVLVQATTDGDQRVCDAAIGGLSLIEGDAATRVLLEVAKSSAERTRAAAMKALGNRDGDPRVVDALLAGFDDPGAWVRYYACQSLGKLAMQGAEAHIERLLADPAGQVRVAAVEALSRVGGAAARAVLLTVAGADDQDIRRAALVGLGMTRDPEVLATLAGAAEATDPMTRLIAISALSAFADKVVLEMLVGAISDSDDAVRTAALGCLSVRAGAEATDALIHLLRSNERPERVVLALASPAKGRVAAIGAALSTADEALARHLVSALGRMGTAEAVDALIEAMTMESPVVRKSAATTLGAIGTDAALETLHRAAKLDADPEVRRVAALLTQS
jgi:HEAT repeat protein